MPPKSKNTTFKIGVTGNICTGKTLVKNALRRAGVNVMDVEEMALNLLSDNPHRLAIRLTDLFGAEVIDSRGRLSRKKLAAVLYTEPAKKLLFEEHVEPVMREEVKKFLYSPMGTFFRAVEAPLLLEEDTKHLYDEVWVVTTQADAQLQRLMQRDNLSLGVAQHLINTEWPQEKKIALGDRVIDNSGDIQQTETQVKKVLDEIKHRIFKMGL